MKKIYLHLGFSKTASTSFQVTCKENIKVLNEQGFVYPLFNSSAITGRKDNENHGTAIYSLFCEAPEDFVGNIRFKVSDYNLLHEDYKATLAECFTNNNKIIISGERISDLSITGLQAFKNYLLQFNAEIFPIIFVRSPYEYHCSQYQQAIKGGFVVDFTQWATQSILINNIKSIFPNTEFFSFRQACAHKHGPTGFLFEKMDVSCDSINFHNLNEGVPNSLIRLQQILNKEEPCFIGDVGENYVLQVLNEQKAFIINGFLNKNYKSICSISSDSFQSKFYLTEAEFEKIKVDFEKENEFFDEVLGEGFRDTNIKFSSIYDSYREIAHYILELRETVNAEKQNGIRLNEKITQLKNELSQATASTGGIDHSLTVYSKDYRKYLKSKYRYYRFLSKLTFGKTKERYLRKKREYKVLLTKPIDMNFERGKNITSNNTSNKLSNEIAPLKTSQEANVAQFHKKLKLMCLMLY